MTDNKDGTVTMTYEELETMVKKNEEYLGDLLDLRDGIMKVLKTLHLTNDAATQIKESIINKTESPMKCILKGGKEIIWLMTEAKFSADAQKEIDEKYKFLDNMEPIISKYGPITKSKALNEADKKQLK